MNRAKVQDRIDWGLNRAAQHVGALVSVYRPCGGHYPLAPNNRKLRIAAVFGSFADGFSKPVVHAPFIARGYFDGSYTRAGDYLVSDEATWFIAQQLPLAPLICARTTHTVSISRMSNADQIGSDSYSNFATAGAEPVLSEWPAAITGLSGGGRQAAGLPTDAPLFNTSILLPTIIPVAVQPLDIVVDGTGRTSTVSDVELTPLGWRITAKILST